MIFILLNKIILNQKKERKTSIFIVIRIRIYKFGIDLLFCFVFFKSFFAVLVTLKFDPIS